MAVYLGIFIVCRHVADFITIEATFWEINKFLYSEVSKSIMIGIFVTVSRASLLGKYSLKMRDFPDCSPFSQPAIRLCSLRRVCCNYRVRQLCGGVWLGSETDLRNLSLIFAFIQ